MKTRLCLLTLLTIATVLGGCYSVYHTTMREYALPCDELLVQRAGEAKRTLDHAQSQLAAVVSMSRDLDRVTADERAMLVHLIGVRLNKAEVGAWNTHRRILAAQDRLGSAVAEHTLSDSVRRKLRDALHEMTDAHAALDMTLIELRSHVDALGDGTDDASVIQFKEVVLNLDAQLQLAIQRSQHASKNTRDLLESLDEYEVAAIEATD